MGLFLEKIKQVLLENLELVHEQEYNKDVYEYSLKLHLV
jgi:hypothetical protein